MQMRGGGIARIAELCDLSTRGHVLADRHRDTARLQVGVERINVRCDANDDKIPAELLWRMHGGRQLKGNVFLHAVMRENDLARSHGVYGSAETEPLLVGRAVAREEAPSRNALEVDGEDLRRADAGAGSDTGIAMRVFRLERSEGCAATTGCHPACADKRRQNCHGGRRGNGDIRPDDFIAAENTS